MTRYTVLPDRPSVLLPTVVAILMIAGTMVPFWSLPL